MSGVSSPVVEKTYWHFRAVFSPRCCPLPLCISAVVVVARYFYRVYVCCWCGDGGVVGGGTDLATYFKCVFTIQNMYILSFRFGDTRKITHSFFFCVCFFPPFFFDLSSNIARGAASGGVFKYMCFVYLTV